MKWYLPIFLLSLALISSGSVKACTDKRISVYETHGVLENYEPGTHMATVAHDAIPGYMAAMIMTFSVHDPDACAHLHRGDILSFHLCVSATSAWLDDVVKTGSTTPAMLQAPAPSAVHELAVGDICPDVELADQSGHSFHLDQLRGDAVAITFFYSGCPLPTYCPLMNENFSHAQDLMKRLGAGGRWHLLTISMDPIHDTPRILSVTADGFHADPQHWTFATGEETRIRNFAAPLGLQFQRSGGRISHNLRTIILDPSGRIYSIYSGNAWTPQDLVSDLRSALRHPGKRSGELTP